MKTFKRITSEHLYDDIRSAAKQAASLFRLYGWTYNENEVPTHSELVETITRLADHALEAFYNSQEEYRDAEAGSGRFSVRVKEFAEEVDVRITLELGEHTWFKAQPKS